MQQKKKMQITVKAAKKLFLNCFANIYQKNNVGKTQN